jgi:hypothetical protein
MRERRTKLRSIQSQVGFGVFLGLTFLLALFTPVSGYFIEGENPFLLSFGLSAVWSLLLVGGLVVYGRQTLWMLFGAPFAYMWPFIAITAQFVGPYD